ncbi:MAG: hypothetical protein Q8S00_07850 [Deltaproteobacteria bacterium]|nr:hypothetical protein [Deltaproteobacteria bacterium]MDZ4342772.1 hypothetical protein [Candidatus Binatia bacterium]
MNYTLDNAAREAKEKEIEAILATLAAGHAVLDPRQTQKLIGSFVTVTPPLLPPPVIKRITISELGRGGGDTRKPGNVTLNWRKLLELVPDVTLAVAGVAGSPWLIPLAALYVWMRLWNAASVSLEEEDAFVVYSLWLHRNGENKISEDNAFLKTETLAHKHGFPAITKEKFTKIIDKLLSLECVEMEEGIIWLREWVRIEY